MDFELTDEQKMLRDSVAQFAAKELKPIAEEIDREDHWPEGMWKKLGALGVLGITVDPVYGGAGADILVNLMKNYTDENRKFRLNAIFGLGYNYYSFGDDYPRLSKTNTMSGNFSLQAAFRLNSHLSIFAEPGIKISTKFYDIENKDDVFAGGMMTVGVIYKF